MKRGEKKKGGMGGGGELQSFVEESHSVESCRRETKKKKGKGDGREDLLLQCIARPAVAVY